VHLQETERREDQQTASLHPVAPPNGNKSTQRSRRKDESLAIQERESDLH